MQFTQAKFNGKLSSSLFQPLEHFLTTPFLSPFSEQDSIYWPQLPEAVFDDIQGLFQFKSPGH